MRIKEATREDMYPIYQDENGTNIFSEEILCSIDHLSEIEGGSIKMYLIDGIFEDVNYVKDVLDMYATYFETKENTFDKLKEKYQDHRFTTGFFFKNIGLR